MGGGNDKITVSHSTLTTTAISQEAIDLSSGDDMLTLGNGVVLNSPVEEIDCGSGFDTIIFAMAVPTNHVDEITAEINSKDPAGDSITINRLFYEWVDCEELIPELTGGFSSPVPTLSQWGLIAMAGLLGVVGFMVMRRRKLTA